MCIMSTHGTAMDALDASSEMLTAQSKLPAGQQCHESICARTNGPDRREERQNEGKTTRPVGQVVPSGKGEMSSVELGSARDGQANDGDECQQQVQHDTWGLESGKQGRKVRAVHAAESKDGDVQAESLRCGRAKLGVVERHGGEEQGGTGPCEGRDGRDIAEEGRVWREWVVRVGREYIQPTSQARKLRYSGGARRWVQK